MCRGNADEKERKNMLNLATQFCGSKEESKREKSTFRIFIL